MTRYVLVAAMLGVLAACSPSGAVRLLTGGGPNVAANVQAGKTNVQAVGKTTISTVKNIRPQARTIDQSAGNTAIRSEAVEAVTINEGAPWGLVYALIALVFVAWELPRSSTIWRNLFG